MNRKQLILLIILSLFSLTIFAQANPFIKGTPNTGQTYRASSGTMQTIVRWQKHFRTEMTEIIKTLKNSPETGSLSLLLGLSFLYGAVHALGPGHRKTVLFSYFISRKSKVRTGVTAGYAMGILHAGAAVILVTMIYFLLHMTLTRTFNDVNLMIEKISYGLLAVMGLFLLAQSFLHRTEKNESKPKSLSFLVLSAGFIPCPGAAAILIFCLGQDVFGIGIGSVAAISLGMGTSVAVLAVLTILFRSRALKTLDKHARIQNGIETAAEIGGALLLILFSLFLLIPML